MFNLSIKKILLFCALFILFLCLIFWRSLLTMGMECGIKYFCEAVLEGEFTSGNIAFTEGKWVIDSVKLQGKKKH